MLRSWVVLALLCSIASAEEVPKLVTAPPSRAQVDAGKKLNVEGLTLHRAKKLDAAIAKYTEALKQDPSNTIARYNLASAFVTKGDSKRALAILGQFQVKSCAFCLQRLRDARADKEWKPLWNDPAFKTLVAFADEPAPAPTPGGGPLSPVADIQLEVSRDQSDAGPDYQAVPADKVRVHAWDAIEPGFYRSPPLDIVLRNKGGEVSRTPLLPAMAQHRTIEIAVPSPGWWVVDVLDAGKVIGSDAIVANETRCLGGARTRTVETGMQNSVYASSAMYGGDVAEDDKPSVTIHRHGVRTGDGAAVVEWRRGGKLVRTDYATLDRELDKKELALLESATRASELDELCPLGAVRDVVSMPSEIARRPGAWELRVYERDAQAYAAKLVWKKSNINGATVTVTPIATPKSITWEEAAEPAVAATASQVRALLRSREAVDARLALNAARAAKKDTSAPAAKLAALVQTHGAPFTDAEMPVPFGGPPATKKVAKARSLPSPGLPAISPDGKSIAFDQEREFYMFSGQCSPPAGGTIEYLDVKEGDASPIRDLSKYEPLTCMVDKVPGGYTIVNPGDDMMVAELRDSKGAVVTKLEGSGNGAHTCFSAKHRVLVMMVHWGVGGDCDVVGGFGPLAAKY